MGKFINPQSIIGDTWLNACYYSSNYEKVMGGLIKILFSWTEPQYILTFCFVFLIILPLTFLIRPDDAYSKTSRLYNITRLSILTFLHRIFYTFILLWPISLIIKQTSPCSGGLNQYKTHFGFFEDYNSYNLPSTWLCSTFFTILYFSSFSTTIHQKLTFIFGILLILLSIHFVFVGELSFAQAFISLSLSYVIHFYSMRAPFFLIHIENILLALFFIVVFIINKKSFLAFSQNKNAINDIIDSDFEIKNNLRHAIMTLSLWIADVFMLARYHYTRSGLINIGRPIDFELEADVNSKSFFKVNEAESDFWKNLKSDLIDSFAGIFLLFIGLVSQQTF